MKTVLIIAMLIMPRVWEIFDILSLLSLYFLLAGLEDADCILCGEISLKEIGVLGAVLGVT